MSFGITAEGFTAPSPSDFIVIVRDDYQARIRQIENDPGLTLDYSADIFLGNITGIMGVQLGSLGDITQGLYDAFDVNNSVGIHLDNLCLIVGVSRKAAVKSTAVALCKGTAGTVIASGLQIEGGGPEDKSRWVLLDTVTIGADGTVEVAVEAEDSTAIIAVNNQIDKIVTPVVGWASVLNVAAAVTGKPRESDTLLRRRRQESLQVGGGRSLAAIRANVLAFSFVTSVAVIENATSAPATVQGLAMTANSYSVIVAPNTLSAAQIESVVKTIYALVPTGIEGIGTDVVTTVTGLDGFAKAVKFNYASALTVTMQLGIRPDPGYSFSGLRDTVKPLIKDYFDAIRVGEAARRLDIFGILDGVQGIQKATVTLNGIADDVEPNIVQILAYDEPASTFVQI